MKGQSRKKPLLIGIGVLIILAVVVLAAYIFLKPDTQKGSKEVTIKVINMAGEEKSYVVKTDAEFLRQVMDEAEGLTYDGAEDATGYMVSTVNGETADYNIDGAYWGFFINGEYCNYGITQQPVSDGDVFSIEYTKG